MITDVLGQRDVQWLSHEIESPFNWSSTVGDSLWDSFLHLRDSIGVGKHGLIRLQTADHNDGILGQFKAQNASHANHSVAVKSGESVMNAALAAYALRQYAEALTLLGGQAERVASVVTFADAQRAAAARSWSACPADGSGPPGVSGWLLRAYLGDETMGWRGQCGGKELPGQPAGGSMWTETQSWALLGDVTPANRTASLLQAIEAIARKPSPIGALNVPPNAMEDIGTSYGGVWACGSQALIQALGKSGQSSTFDEFRKNLLGTHAEVYPEIFFGVTSGTDVWNSALSTWPGSTRCEYQSPDGLDGHPAHGGCNELALGLLNSWQHSVPLWSLGSLVGLEFDAGGMRLVPELPSLPSFAIATALFGVERARGAGETRYSGWWSPEHGGGTLATVTLRLPAEDAASCGTVVVNGVRGSCAELKSASGDVVLRGVLPLRWSLVAGAGAGAGAGAAHPLHG